MQCDHSLESRIGSCFVIHIVSKKVPQLLYFLENQDGLPQQLLNGFSDILQGIFPDGLIYRLQFLALPLGQLFRF